LKNSLWISEDSLPDTHVAFRASFELRRAAQVEINTVGSSWYRAWLDGAWLLEGPLRYAVNRPEYDVHEVELAAGRHVLAFHVHHIGVDTRILAKAPPYIWCSLFVEGEELPLEWRAIRLSGYRSGLRRINPQLGWVENCFTGENPNGWQLLDFDSASWPHPVSSASPLPEPGKADLANIQRMEIPMRQIAGGALATTFIYPTDDPPTTFFLRDLNPITLPALGLWCRYDLGRIRLGSPEFVVEAPAGTILEIA
jgi:alpha-L-rhamnosidase